MLLLSCALPLGRGALPPPTVMLFLDDHWVASSTGLEAVVGGIWHKISPVQLVILLAVCGVLLAIVLAATTFGARALGFSPEDERAITFCGSKKSLATGVPMAGILFPGPTAGIIVLPLMIFHQIQLMACSVIAQHYAKQSKEA